MAEAELKIPVFTVLKNGAILKNIFIVNESPSEEAHGREEILIVGRHPDCNIVLTHPSVSRFHLQIYSTPQSQKLAVMDLSSVHGTWVSERKIEPGEKVELTDGDILRVGGSSRVYELHWVPLSQAYDLQQSFVSATDTSLVEEIEECTAAGEAYQDNVSADIECDKLANIFAPSDLIEEKYSSLSEGEMAETAEDGCLLKITDDEEVEKFANPFSETGKENPTITGDIIEAFQDGGSLDSENKNFQDPSSGKEKTEIYQDMSSEDQEIYSLDLILGEVVASTFSQLPGHYGTSAGLTISENMGSPTIHEDVALKNPSEIEPIQIHNSITSQIFASDSFCLPAAYQSPSDNLTFDDDSSGRWMSENELIESRWSSGDRDESIESSVQFSTLCPSESAPLPQKILADQLLYAEPELLSENEKLKVCITDNCEGTDQPEQGDLLSIDSVNPATRTLNSVLSEQNILSEVSCQYVHREHQHARSPFSRVGQSETESPPIKSSSKANMSSIWSRRGKLTTALHLQTGSSRGKSRSSVFQYDNGQNIKEDVQVKLIDRNLSADSDGEEEIFTPDKENMTPNTWKLKFMKEVGKAGLLHSNQLKGSSSKEISSSPKIYFNEENCQPPDRENQTPMRKKFTPESLAPKSAKSSKIFSGPISNLDDLFYSSDKENQNPKFQREQRKVGHSSSSRLRLVEEISGANRRERMPFQALHMNSPMECHSSGPGASTSSSSIESIGKIGKKVADFVSDNSSGAREKSWTMVVDTTSFLDQESRKTLQLLQGLRGTQLVIPRIVLRELDALSRQLSLFRRNSEFSSVLEWIQESMVNSSWWIKVQNSAEESWAVAPTPRASPYPIIEASDTTMIATSPARFPFNGISPLEIASPATEDRIIEYALQIRKSNRNGQLVLLSNDLSVKIKAMAEGLLCETPQQFRESLVDPFSKRFMWAESCPRGQTWTLKDDVVLKDKYFRHPLKKKPSPAKGLKLILRHNSQYGQMKTYD